MSALTAREVAAVTDLSERRVRQLADELDAAPGPDRGRNGVAQRLYPLASLPPAAQAAWARGEKVVEMRPATASGQLALALTATVGPNLSEADRQEAERRYRAIEALVDPERFRPFWAQYRGRKGAVVGALCAQHDVRPRTLYAWVERFEAGGIAALVSKGRADKGAPRSLNQAAMDFLLAAALPRRGSYGSLSVAEIYRAYEEERVWRAAHVGQEMPKFEAAKYARFLDDEGRLTTAALLPECSYETLRAWYQRIPEVAKIMAREGLEAYANTQEILSFRDLEAVQPMEYVVMDHRRLDVFCLMRNGRDGWKLARPWLTAAIDMRTRRWLAWAVVETPSSDSIATVLKRVFLDHGLPTALYWDNGRDFACEWFEGREHRSRTADPVGELSTAWRGVVASLGVRIHHAIVKRARSKIIEPNFNAISNFDRTLPEWCGHNPSARPERFEELVREHEQWVKGEREATPFRTIEEVAGIYDAAIEQLNERDHSGLGMRKVTVNGYGWMSPNEAWERLIKGVERRAVSAEILQFAFARRREVTVRNGEVRMTFAGTVYHYRLENAIRLMAFNGEKVEAAYDPADLGEVALYLDGATFLGIARCLELRRMGEDSFVDDERDRRTARREVKRFIQAVHQQVYVPGPVERLARRQAVAPVRVEPERPMIAAPVPPAIAAIAAAAEAAAEERRPVAAVEVPVVSAASDDDGAFDFFNN